jgi:hypothetical protein
MDIATITTDSCKVKASGETKRWRPPIRLLFRAAQRVVRS